MAQRFHPDDERLAGQLKALAHPARLKIVDVLAARGTCVCREIVDVLPLAQATVSQHLKILKDTGFLERTIEGLHSCYCLNIDAFTKLRTVLSTRLGRLENACCSSLQTEREITS